MMKGAESMKWGELIILWIGGLLSIIPLMVGWPSDLDVRLYGAGIVVVRVVEKVSIVLAIWILCGLAWVTLYKRSRTKEKGTDGKPTTRPQKTGDSTTPILPNQAEVVLTEKETGEEKLKTSEESYGASELGIMKRQFMGLLRGFALWYVVVLLLAMIGLLAGKFF
jgi:hypothetical protein